MTLTPRNNGGSWTFLETAFAPHFLRKLSVIGKPFLAVSTFVQKKLVHSLAEHFQTTVNKLNNVNGNYEKIPRNHPGPHVWDPWSNL